MADHADLEPVSLREQLAEAERELQMRRVVYPSRVRAGKMRQYQADHYIRVQQAIIATLRAAVDQGVLPPAPDEDANEG
jgi:hypothetical protein